MILAAYMVAGGLAATPYAVGLLRGRRDRYTRLGFGIPFTVAVIAAPFQIAVGDTAARAIASQQPVKFASMEYVPRTTSGATEWLGGVWYHGHVVTGTGIPVPYADSLLVGFSPRTRVTGWSTVPPRLRPPMPTLIHLAFDLMVVIGFLMLLWGLWLAWSWWRHRALPGGRLGRVFLAGGALSGVATVTAMESGWVVTEVGRQPWTVYNVLTTSQAATTASGVPATLAATLAIYSVLTVGTFGILWVVKRRWDQEAATAGAGGSTGAPGTGPAEAEGPRAPTAEQAGGRP
jgi:cytochrome d ubiquinol oxidase subunit I